ncbi:MAG: hypothetical protein LBD23_09880, partial [Oscillospiraceae bacterium]|nr:hypothetical protein [Oscillospiraceae bacterium]
NDKWLRIIRKTTSGNTRLEIAEEILKMAKKDAAALVNGATEVAKNPQGMMLFDIVSQKARTEKIDLDKNPRQVETVGGVSNTRLKFKREDGTTVFYSPEEKLDTPENSTQKAIAGIKDEKLRAKFTALNENDEDFFYEAYWGRMTSMETVNMQLAAANETMHNSYYDYVMKHFKHIIEVTHNAWNKTNNIAPADGSFFTDPEKSSELEMIIGYIKMISRAKVGADNAGNIGGLEVGQIISNRNVAMSRVADLLGIGSLLARSTNAEVTRNKKKEKGNLMEQARGREAADLGKDLLTADKTDGDLQLQVTSLQLLDSICLQADRHFANMLYDTEMVGEGKNKQMRIKGIQGIDNDFAFSGKYKKDGSDVDNVGKTQLKQGRKILPKLFNDEENLTIPVFDEKLADRIIALSPDVLRLAVGDIIVLNSEMEALVQRFEAIREAIINLKKNNPEALIKKGGWGAKTHQKLMDAKVGNYYNTFVNIDKD